MSTTSQLSETMIALRCPRQTRDGVAALAARRGKSTSELLRDLISAALGNDEGPRRPPPSAVAA